jgi:hypothetical protein
VSCSDRAKCEHACDAVAPLTAGVSEQKRASVAWRSYSELDERRGDVKRKGRRAFVFTIAAVAWAGALIPAAFLAPFYRGESASSDGRAVLSTTSTLVAQNGLWVLLPVSLPLLLALLAWFGLHRRCSRGSRLGAPVAWGAVGVLTAFSAVAALSVGPLMLPVVLLLAAAAASTPVGLQPVA